MSLPASEEKVLNGIERALVSRDPRLTSLFAIFTRLNLHEAMPALEQLRRRRRRWRPPQTVVIALVIALLAGIVVLSSVLSPRACVPATAATAQPAAHGSARAAATAQPAAATAQPIAGVTLAGRCGAG